MFAIGHFGLGYLLGKGSAKIINTRVNLALLFTVSVLPDADFVLSNFLVHRGPTHSLFFSFLVFLPVFVIYRKKAIPYFVALLSHSLVGDIYSHIAGVQLFWPFSTEWFTIADISNLSLLSIVFELALFTLTMLIILVNKKFQESFLSITSKIYWLLPFGSVIGPMLLSGINSTLNFPFLLIFPSIFYLVLFSISIMGLNYRKYVF